MDTGYGDKKMAGYGQAHRPGLSCGHTNPPDGSTSFPQKTKLSFTTTVYAKLGKIFWVSL